MTTVVILSTAVAMAVALPIAWRVRQRRFDPFEPIVVFALAWGVMFVVRPIAIVVRDDTDFYGVDIGPTLDESVLLGLLGAVGFVLGYHVRFGRELASRLPRQPSVAPTARTLVVAGIVGVLAMLTFLLYLLLAGGSSAIGTFFGGRGPELNDLLRDSPLWLWSASLAIVPAALVGLAVALRKRSPVTAVGTAALVALALVRFVPTGTRLYLLMLVGGAIVFAYLSRQRRPGRLALVLGLVVALVGSYTLLLVRYGENRESLSSGLISTPSRVVATVTKEPDSEMAPALAGALLVIPSELPHRYGAATFGDLVTRPVPRQLWSGKPQPHPIVVTEKVWPTARATGDFQPNFTPLLAFYWDFGLVGAFLGLALYGTLARLAWEYFLRQPGHWVVQLLYALSFWTVVVALRSDPVLLVFHCAVMLIPVLFIVRLGAAAAPLGAEPALELTPGCATRVTVGTTGRLDDHE